MNSPIPDESTHTHSPLGLSVLYANMIRQEKDYSQHTTTITKLTISK
jgi:hypothetical protein